jgi:hypothetical protein
MSTSLLTSELPDPETDSEALELELLDRAHIADLQLLRKPRFLWCRRRASILSVLESLPPYGSENQNAMEKVKISVKRDTFSRSAANF